MPLLNFLIDSIAAAALVYVAVAFVLSLSAKFVMPRPKIAPGQLELDFAAVEPPAIVPMPAAAVVDPWTLPLEETIAAPTIPAAVVPMFTTPPYLLLLTAAAAVPTDAQTEPIAVVPNWAAMTPAELRKACQQQGIKWRNAHGKNAHLKKAEMIARLVAASTPSPKSKTNGCRSWMRLEAS